MEFDEIMVKESPGLCRCCLSEGCYKDMSTEYSWMNENEVYADMLLECFDISISQVNDGPNGPNRLICEVCITRLRDACYFKKQVLESEKKFVDMVGRGEFKPKAVLVYPSNMKAETSEVELHFTDEDAEVEYLEDEMDFGDDDVLKSEAHEPEAGASDVTADPLPVRGKRGRPRKPPAKPVKKKVKSEPKPKASKALVKGPCRKRRVCLGSLSKEGLRSRRFREKETPEQRKKRYELYRDKYKKKAREIPRQETEVDTQIFIEPPFENQTPIKVKKSKSKRKTPATMPRSKAEKTAYQFAKPIISATKTTKSYNQVVQQHLSQSNIGEAKDIQVNDDRDSSRKNILQHMKLAMGRVKLVKNTQ